MKLRTLVVLGLMVAGAALADVWDVSPGFEGEPAATDPVSQGDDEIRLGRVESRKRLDVEHHFGTATDADDNGTHRVGSARCFVQAAQPTVTEVADYNNTGGAGTATLSDNATNSAPAETVGHGRCWIDTDGLDNVAGTSDDNVMWVYDGGWSLNLTDRVGPIPQAVYNGSFEVNSTSATTAPDGWTAVNSPDIAYTAVTVSEGTGRAVSLTANGGADEGISQTLVGLRASTNYRVVVRANATTAGDTCSIRTTGGTVNASDTTTGTAAYETLLGSFTTDPTPTDVVLILEANTDTDVCLFDNIYVYGPNDLRQTGGYVGQIGCFPASAFDIPGAATGSYTTYVTRSVTPPGPGYYIRVTGNAAASANTGNDMQLLARLRENNTTDVDLRAAATTINGSTVSVPLHYIKTDPTPGTTYEYDLDMAESSAIGTGDFDPADQSCLSVELIPAR